MNSACVTVFTTPLFSPLLHVQLIEPDNNTSLPYLISNATLIASPSIHLEKFICYIFGGPDGRTISHQVQLRVEPSGIYTVVVFKIHIPLMHLRLTFHCGATPRLTCLAARVGACTHSLTASVHCYNYTPYTMVSLDRLGVCMGGCVLLLTALQLFHVYYKCHSLLALWLCSFYTAVPIVRVV